MNTNAIDEKVEFFGKELIVSEVTNPHLKRALTDRREKGYSDHSKHTHSEKWSEYGDHREKYHERYEDYNDKPYSDYAQYWNSCNFPETTDGKTEQIEFFGKELKVSEITNPHLRRVLTDKRLSGYNEGGQYKTDWTDDYWDQPYQDKS